MVWLRFYLNFAFKNLIKNKYYTSINILGLVFGMLSVLIISKYIGGSLQFDRFHEKKDHIFSIGQHEHSNGQSQERSSTYLGVAELLDQVGEADYYTHYYQQVESLVLAEDGYNEPVSFTENKIFVTDSSFLKIFTFAMLRGDDKPHYQEKILLS